MSSVSNQLIELFDLKEFAGQRKIIISSEGTSIRNNLKKYLNPGDLLYAEVLPNPSLGQLIKFFKSIQPKPDDIVFGIGGGSVIDFSKLVALFAATHRFEIKSIIESTRFRSIETALRLVVVPTLYGSGAEQTPFAVCYIGQKKYSVANSLLMPASIRYIPEMNISASSNTKLANVLDCFCQAAESLTAKNSTDFSVEYAERTLRILVPIAKEYIEESTTDLAAKMAEASSFCGKAIAISKTTGPHAMSYFLTSTLRWNHGTAVAMAFLLFFNIYKETKEENPFLKRALDILAEVLPFKSLEEYFRMLGLEVESLAEELIDKIKVTEWISNINIERLSNGPDIDMNLFSEDNIYNYYTRLLKS